MDKNQFKEEIEAAGSSYDEVASSYEHEEGEADTFDRWIEQSENSAQVLRGAFVWEEHPKGVRFWLEVMNKLVEPK